MESFQIQQTREAIAAIELLAECERYEPEVGFTCKTKAVEHDSFVECLEKRSQACPFSVPCGRAHYCTSPARIYAAKKLKN